MNVRNDKLACTILIVLGLTLAVGVQCGQGKGLGGGKGKGRQAGKQCGGISQSHCQMEQTSCLSPTNEGFQGQGKGYGRGKGKGPHYRGGRGINNGINAANSESSLCGGKGRAKGFGYGKGQGNGQGRGRHYRGGHGVNRNLSAASNNQPLLDSVKATVLLMREEEKLARDVYSALGKKWNMPIFDNISGAEQRHMAAIKTIITQNNLEDSVKDDTPGVFQSEKMARLYAKLTAQGGQSYVDALKAGVLIEEMDIVDLQKAITATDNPQITRVYGNLLRASRNHLRAFAGQLKDLGIGYTPEYLTKEMFEQIIDSPHERGQGRNGNGWGRGRHRGNGLGRGMGHGCRHGQNQMQDFNNQSVTPQQGYGRQHGRQMGMGHGRGQGMGPGQGRGYGWARQAR